VFNPQPDSEAATGLAQDASGVPSGVVIERRRRRRRYRRRQTPTAQLVARLTELTNRLQSSAEAAQPPAFSKSMVDAEVQCDLVEAPPLKQRRRQVNVVAGINSPWQQQRLPRQRLPSRRRRPQRRLRYQLHNHQPRGNTTSRLPSMLANLIYQELHPVALDVLSFRSTFRRPPGCYQVQSSDRRCTYIYPQWYHRLRQPISSRLQVEFPSRCRQLTTLRHQTTSLHRTTTGIPIVTVTV
jgi:hypothetical protein